MTTLVRIAVVALLAGTLDGYQVGSAPVGTAGLEGRLVFAGGDDEPVRRAAVILSGSRTDGGRVTITDRHGRFTFEALPAGRYTLRATKAAHVTSYFGSRRPGRGPGSPIALADGQQLTGLTMRMTRGAVITGRVKDHVGRPQPGAIVSILEARGADGSLGAVATATTNDLGEYRVYGLAPGRFLVAAQPGFGFNGAAEPTDADYEWAWTEARRRTSGGLGGVAAPARPPPPRRQTVSYAPTLFPGALDVSSATPVDLPAGVVLQDIDIQLLMVPTTRLRGVVLDPAGVAPRALEVAVVWPGHELGLSEKNYIGQGPSNLGMTVRDGRFTRLALAPGRYTFFARASSQAGALDLWARADVDINGELERDLHMTLQPGMRIAGRVLPESLRSGVRLALIPVSDALNLAIDPVAVDADGGFAFTGLPPGDYALRVAAPDDSGRTIVSSSAGGVDVSDDFLTVHPGQNLADVRVVVAERRTSLTGRLVDALGRPAPEYVIVVFSTDRGSWHPLSRRIGEARPATDGVYAVSGLPDGDYFVAAVTELEPGDLHDPGFLELLAASAQRVRLGGDAGHMLDLQIAGGG